MEHNGCAPLPRPCCGEAGRSRRGRQSGGSATCFHFQVLSRFPFLCMTGFCERLIFSCPEATQGSRNHNRRPSLRLHFLLSCTNSKRSRINRNFPSCHFPHKSYKLHNNRAEMNSFLEVRDEGLMSVQVQPDRIIGNLAPF